MVITEQEMKKFAGRFFPGKAMNYASNECVQIQAGEQYGLSLHYEYYAGKVHLHIEQEDWRPLRDYLKANLKSEQLIPSKWGRIDCQWTIHNDIKSEQDLFQAFLDIRSIIEPVIEKFEGKEPQDYKQYKLSQTKEVSPEGENSAVQSLEVNLTNLAQTEQIVVRDANITEVKTVSRAYLIGNWIGKNGVPVEVCQIQREAEFIRVQMHIYDDSYCKGVLLLLTQKGTDICGKIEWAKGTNRRSERNANTENIMLGDWNNLPKDIFENVPIGKKGYGIEKMTLEMMSAEDAVNEEREKIVERIEETNEKSVKTKELPEPTINIKPITLPSVSVTRTIAPLGITLKKTYDKFAEAPIQGVDALGRRTKEVFVSNMPLLNSKKNVCLDLHSSIQDSDLVTFVNKCFLSAFSNHPEISYDAIFWKYLANQDSNKFSIETGYELKSTFDVLSIIPNFNHNISVADDDNESSHPSFAFENSYANGEVSPEDLLSLCSAENITDVKDDEITFSSPKFNNLQTIIGSYKTPKSFDNICPECGGEKKIRCSRCYGSGREQYQEGEYADGRPKIKTGKCGKCFGHGYFVCKACKETGKIDQGTGMIKIQETTNSNLKLREKASVANTFFKTNQNRIDGNSNKINNIWKNSSNYAKKKTKNLKSGCEHFVYWWKCLDEKCSIGTSSFFDSDFREIENVFGLLADWHNLKKSFHYGIEKQLRNLNELSMTVEAVESLEKEINQINQSVFSSQNVEVIFKNEREIAFDNKHSQFQFNRIPKDKLDFLYQLNVEKAQSAFKLDNQDERILGILERHEIVNTLLKISIPLETNKSFVVYYSEKDNQLFYFGNLPEIKTVNILLEKELEVKRQRQEEQRQAYYSQSMDALLNEPTKKIGAFSKLFKTKSFKDALDSEKAVKLLIYMAKADGKLDVDEKELLTRVILNDYNEAYTVENRQQFIDLLNKNSLPELTVEDVTFSSPKMLKNIINKIEMMANIDGITEQEKKLLEKIRELSGVKQN